MCGPFGILVTAIGCAISGAGGGRLHCKTRLNRHCRSRLVICRCRDLEAYMPGYNKIASDLESTCDRLVPAGTLCSCPELYPVLMKLYK